MAQYPKPTSISGIFNNQNFVHPDTGGLTIEEAEKYFITFPNTQSPSTIIADNFNTTGDLNIGGDSQFGGNATFIGGATITGPLIFSDDVEVDGTTTLNDTLLCLSTAEIDGELTVNNNIILNVDPVNPLIPTYIQFSDGTEQTTAYDDTNAVQNDQDNTFLAPYIQTFQQNNSTTSSTAPIQINNIDNLDNIALYIDPSAGNDLTLYSSQSNGGLTVRNPTASFTLNPVSFVPGVVGAQSLNPIDMNNQGLYGLNNVYADGTTITFNDSASTPMLQLTNTGHTSYGNISMNNNNISGINIISGNGTSNITCNSTIGMGSGKSINMNNNSILLISSLSGGSGTTPITINSPILMSAASNLQMNNNSITGITSLSGVGSALVTTTTPLNNNVTTAIATTGYVTTQAPAYTTGITITLFGSSSAFLTFYSTPPAQSSQSIVYVNGTKYVNFFSSPFILNVPSNYYNSGGTFNDPINNPMTQIKFSAKPWDYTFPPTPAQDTLYGTTSNGTQIQCAVYWNTFGGNYYLNLGFPTNLSPSVLLYFDFASLGLF